MKGRKPINPELKKKRRDISITDAEWARLEKLADNYTQGSASAMIVKLINEAFNENYRVLN